MGLATSLLVACVIAGYAPRQPIYPRDVGGYFVQWNRPWQISGVRTFGMKEWWWMDLSADSCVACPKDSPEALVKFMRDKGASQAQPSTIPHHDYPPAWGLFARAQPAPPDFIIGTDAAFGWPALCMWDQITGVLTGNKVHSDQLHGGHLLSGEPSSRGRNCVALPLRPLWGGLLINTIFFAMCWAVLLFGPGAFRRGRRRARGLCIVCAYDLKHNYAGGCPECGCGRATDA